MTPSLLFEVGVSLVLQISLLVAVAAAFDRICNSALRSNQIWTATFVATLLLTVGAFGLPHMRWLGLRVEADASTLGAVLRFQMLAVKLLGLAWLLGFVAHLLSRLRRCLALFHFLKVQCGPLTSAQQAALPGDIFSQAPRGTRWLVSDQRHGPFCWQLHQPTIVLPLDVFELDPETQGHILRHEYEHLSTGHPLQHFLQGLCSTLFWFHPAVRLAAGRAELAREYWCDEVAASNREGVAGYLRSLAAAGEQSVDAPPCTLAMSRHGSAIVRRSRRLAELIKRREWSPAQDSPRGPLIFVCVLLAAAVISQVWLPVNLLASERDRMSPWPAWTAGVLHDFGVSVRDYEAFDHRREAQELLNPDDDE
ncbi:MAG: M56 family metallopeptidase [Planctomycetales bacterium]|nr:M56 family metallopeptidase [Planctomycetales bacterium]